MALETLDLSSNFSAVAGVFKDEAFLEFLSQNANIDYVEPNQIFKVDAVLPNAVIRKQASNWGLSRIHQHEKTSASDAGYPVDLNAGAGIDVYVLDTGVFADHVDFGGRAKVSANLIRGEEDVDVGGHGTHVSAKIIGLEYGVAKSAQVHAVKILNKSGEGSTSTLLKGLEHVLKNAKPGKAIVNLSLSGPKSKMVNEVLNQLVLGKNVPVFASAGNSGVDACRFSPSSNPNVFSVGAADSEDNVPGYSDVGNCVSIYAPGSNIMSAYVGSKDASRAMDGTSMASPHVAGIAANLMSKRTYGSAKELYDAIRAAGTKNVLTFSQHRNFSENINLLAFNPVE
ncbi:subtilisin-like protein [Backusella circina FSU 941]|nr:subtilisin-like protein [Backusella circina FSU 941]